MTPLRQRMSDDLLLRNYSDRTSKAYLRCVSNFARHFGKSPDQLGPRQIREYQLYLVKQKQCSWAVFNQTVCALRFFYNTTLGCKEMIEEIPYPRFEKRLPVVLSQMEVAALLQAVKNLKHRTLLTTIYATGLRVSEVTNLLVSDIDSSRMIVQVRQGKGRKDRFVMLSPNLLTLLRQYWKAYHPRHWLFPGQKPSGPINNVRLKWIKQYPAMVKQLEKDLRELLSFMNVSKPLWKKLRTTNVIERCFVEVRRRTRPMVCFVNVGSVDRILYSIFNRFNLDWENRSLRAFTQAA